MKQKIFTFFASLMLLVGSFSAVRAEETRPDTIQVSRARLLIDANDTLPHYVIGVVRGGITSPTSTFKGNVVFWMTDVHNPQDSLQAYGVYGPNNEKWASVAAAKEVFGEGDTVLVCANKLSLYAAKNYYEVNGGYFAELLGKYQEDPTVTYDHTTVERAIATADTLAVNATHAIKFCVEGYVAHAQAYNFANGDQTFYMYDEGMGEEQDSLLMAYKANPRKNGKAYPVLDGDKVRAYGYLKKYIDVQNGNKKILEVVEPRVEFISEVEGDRNLLMLKDTLTVAEALEIGSMLAANTSTDKTYVIGGYVSNIVTYFNATTSRETFWMADDKESTAATNADGAIEVYNGKVDQNVAAELHAKVYVTAKIQYYKGTTIETANSSTVNIVEQGVEEVIEPITVARALEIGLSDDETIMKYGVSLKRYEITGYVAAVEEYYTYYKNETFWITDIKGERTNDKTKAFEVYRGKPNTNMEIGYDAKIKIVCKIKNYNGTIENDGTNIEFEVLEQGELKFDTLSVASATEIANALEEGARTIEDYFIKGYVTKAYEYDTTYKYQQWYMADYPDEQGEFCAYRCYVDTAVKEGDYIQLFGKIDKHTTSSGKTYLEVTRGTATHIDAPEISPYYISYRYDAAQGYVSGPTTARPMQTITFTAIPNNNYHFAQWSDGVTDNPRTARISKDTIFTALFAVDTTGTCGKDLALTWAYNPSSKQLTISGKGSFDENMDCGLEAKANMTSLVIDEGVTAIGKEAFSNCATLTTIQLPASLKTIDEKAFYNCLELTSIYNYRVNPCLIESNTFERVNTFDCTLYVLAGSETKYSSEASGWKIFYTILPIGSTTVEETITEVETIPNDNNVIVTWPVADGANTYTLEISKDGIVFCTLIFNANGQLLGIAFAPSRDDPANAPAATFTANGGLQFTVTGLNSGTQYNLDVIAKDAENKVIKQHQTSFTTTGAPTMPTGIDQINMPSEIINCKFIHNGQLFIMRDGHIYTVTGVEVKGER